jgi:molecular chaperone GrpE (heat shock protein)
MHEDLTPELPIDLPAPPETGVADWKEMLRRDFERWLATIEDLPAAASAAGSEPVPDLASFYEQLAALGAESRRANRRTTEAFSQWGDTLQKFETELDRLRTQLNDRAADRADDDGLPRAHCLALLELLDRLQRLQKAFAAPPTGSWWAGDKRWRKVWSTQHDAFDIVVGHLETLLQQAGVERLPTLDEPFDPAVMVAVATEPDADLPHHTVLEEILPGYQRHGELLRPAQVKLSLNKGTP